MESLHSIPDFLPSNTSLSPLGSGRRSNAYVAESPRVSRLVEENLATSVYRGSESETNTFILKEVRDIPVGFTHQTLGNRLRQQYTLLQQYLGEYVVPTEFIISSQDEFRDKVPRLYIMQPKIAGITLTEALEKRERKLDLIIDFFDRSIFMWTKTTQVPDVTGMIRRFLFFRPWYTSNLVITEKEDFYKPNLIDTNFSHKSEAWWGIITRTMTAVAMQSFLNSLKHEEEFLFPPLY